MKGLFHNLDPHVYISKGVTYALLQFLILPSFPALFSPVTLFTTWRAQYFIILSLSPRWKLPEDRESFCLSCSLLYPQYVEQNLAQNKSSVNITEKIRKGMNGREEIKPGFSSILAIVSDCCNSWFSMCS